MVMTSDKGIDVYEAGPNSVTPLESQESYETPYISDQGKDKLMTNVLELTPKNDLESVKEKYNRLRSDAFLLHEQIDREQLKDGNEFHVRPVDDIRFLIGSLKKSIENSVESPDFNSNLIRLNALKDRAQALEKSLGLGTSVVDDQPLTKVVEDLRTRIQILTPGYLTTVFKRIQELNKHNSANSDAISSITTNECISKDDKPVITELGALINRWDERCKELAPTVESLKVSQSLFHDAERVILKWDKLMTLKQSVMHALAYHKKDQELCDQRNTERINSLMQRLENLKESTA